MPVSTDQIRDKLLKINDTIIESEYLAREGKMTNLGSTDRDVAALCQQCRSLPAEAAAEIQPLMAEMIGNLERLARTIEDYKDTVQKKKKT